MWSSDASFVVDQLERLNESDPQESSKEGSISHLRTFIRWRDRTAVLPRRQAMQGRNAYRWDAVRKRRSESASQPFLFLLSDHTSELSTTEGREVLADIHSVYDHSKGSRHVVMIRGANHFTFTDQMVTKSSYFIRAFLLVKRGPSALRGLAITRAYVHTFFDAYLKGAPVDELAKIRQSFPEVQTFDDLPPESPAR
jgi:hypothetical protein